MFENKDFSFVDGGIQFYQNDKNSDFEAKHPLQPTNSYTPSILEISNAKERVYKWRTLGVLPKITPSELDKLYKENGFYFLVWDEERKEWKA